MPAVAGVALHGGRALAPLHVVDRHRTAVQPNRQDVGAVRREVESGYARRGFEVPQGVPGVLEAPERNEALR